MKNENTPSDDKTEGRSSKRQPHIVRLPGFIVEEEIGLGDAIKRVTYAMGIKPCSGCERRATVLNQSMRFSRW